MKEEEEEERKSENMHMNGTKGPINCRLKWIACSVLRLFEIVSFHGRLFIHLNTNNNGAMAKKLKIRIILEKKTNKTSHFYVSKMENLIILFYNFK